MNIDEVKSWILPIAVSINAIVTFAGFWVAAKRFRRQTHASIFIEFTKRFEDLFDRFPKDFKLLRIKREADLPGESEHATDIADRLYSLLSQEYYMHRKKYLGKDIWNVWEPSIRDMIKTPLMIREWGNVSHRFDPYPDFKKYVEECHTEASEVKAKEIKKCEQRAPGSVA